MEPEGLQGVLVECDPSVKQYLLHLNEEHEFVLQDLDATHLFITANKRDMIEEKVRELHERVAFKNPLLSDGKSAK